MALEITDSNFESLVLKADKPVMLDFWAPWCAPCRTISPVVDEMHAEYEGKAYIGKVNVDESSDIPANYAIRNIPSILFFKDGKMIEKIVGVVPKTTLTGKLDALL